MVVEQPRVPSDRMRPMEPAVAPPPQPSCTHRRTIGWQGKVTISFCYSQCASDKSVLTATALRQALKSVKPLKPPVTVHCQCQAACSSQADDNWPTYTWFNCNYIHNFQKPITPVHTKIKVAVHWCLPAKICLWLLMTFL